MNRQKFSSYFPIIGIGLYFALFIYSAGKYPGGSRIHPAFIGFDWTHNYWCDLMGKESYNGLKNDARPFAIAAWIIVCLSILFIFLKAVKLFYPSGKWHTIFKTTSILAVIIGIFSFTDYHDLVVAVCFPFGATIAIALTVGLIKSTMTVYKYSVWLPLLLLSASFYSYFTNTALQYLGVLQKISLLVTMAWLVAFYISLLSRKMNQSH